MTVQEKIKQVIESLGEVYLHENWQTANVRIDKMPLPCVLNVLPVSGAFQFGTSRVKDKPNCMIAFMDKSDFDFDGQNNDVVVERCKCRAMAFLIELGRSGLFKQVTGDIRYSVFYDRMDVNVTGIVIEFTPEEIQGTILCPGKTSKEIADGR